jgi:hypothetical protein
VGWARWAEQETGPAENKIKENENKTGGCKELWAENDFGLPRENKNVFEIFWLQI